MIEDTFGYIFISFMFTLPCVASLTLDSYIFHHTAEETTNLCHYLISHIWIGAQSDKLWALENLRRSNSLLYK